LLALQARLASIPLHYPWIVDAQVALFREQLGKISKNNSVKIGILSREVGWLEDWIFTQQRPGNQKATQTLE
jgi:hypothetical protein